MQKVLQFGVWVFAFTFLISNTAYGQQQPEYRYYRSGPVQSSSEQDLFYRLKLDMPNSGLVTGSTPDGWLSAAYRNSMGRVIYFKKDLHRAPALEESTDNYARYNFQPFSNVNVTVSHWVYSPRRFIQQYTVANSRSDTVRVDLFPFYQQSMTIDSVQFNETGNTIRLWTHNPKHDTKHRELLYLDRDPNSYGQYGALGPLDGEPTLSMANTQQQEETVVEYGNVYQSDGSLCTASPPEATMVVWKGHERNEILTEQAHKLQQDSTQLNITGNGVQRMQLNLFSDGLQSESTFSVLFSCGRQQGIVSQPLEADADSIETDIQLHDSAFTAPPSGVDARTSSDFSSVLLTWDAQEGYRYHVYKRGVNSPGRFQLLADSIEGSNYFDFTEEDKQYFYTILAEDSTGRISSHSTVVAKQMPEPPPQPAVSFFEDVYRGRLSNQQHRYLTEVVGAELSLKPAAGEDVVFSLTRYRLKDDESWASAETKVRNNVPKPDQAPDESRAFYDAVPPLTDFENNPALESWWIDNFTLLRQSLRMHSNTDGYMLVGDPLKGESPQTVQSLLALPLLTASAPDKARSVLQHLLYAQRPGGWIPARIESDGTQSDSLAAAPILNTIYLRFAENLQRYHPARYDTAFLGRAYESGKEFYGWWVEHHDTDTDSLYNWNDLEERAQLFNVRPPEGVNSQNISEIEAVELNALLTAELKALAGLADRLNREDEASLWRRKAHRLTGKINEVFWSSDDGIFYSADASDHDFMLENNGVDLRQSATTSFMPLWADAINTARTEQLLATLTDEDRFWRRHGIAELEAATPDYRAGVSGYGAVNAVDQYFIFSGLLEASGNERARALAETARERQLQTLDDLHTFTAAWNPDGPMLDFGTRHLAAALPAVMMMERVTVSVPEQETTRTRPLKTRIEGNYPNPFNPTTTVTYTLDKAAKTNVRVFDMLGRRVAELVDRKQQAGSHRLRFDGEGLSSGVYIIQLRAAGTVSHHKMLLIK